MVIGTFHWNYPGKIHAFENNYLAVMTLWYPYITSTKSKSYPSLEIVSATPDFKKPMFILK